MIRYQFIITNYYIMYSKILFLTLTITLLKVAEQKWQLKFIQVVSRHGVRYPSYPNQYDHSDITVIRHAHNQLTIEGKSMHYLLGKQLYQNYWKLLFENSSYLTSYDRPLISAKSTNTNRTIQSLQSQIIGLLQDVKIVNEIKPNQYYFPPFSKTNETKQVLSANEQKRLQQLFTFPIHMEKGAQGDPRIANLQYEGDFLVKEQANLCPNQPIWQQKNYNSAWALSLKDNKKLKPAIDLLNSIYHRDNISIKDAYKYIDNYICLKAMGQAYLKDFQRADVKESLQFLYVGRLYLNYLYTQQQKKTFSTRLIANTIQNMKKSAQGNKPKIVLYTAHDITIAVLLSSMNFTSLQCISERYLQGKNVSSCYYKYPSFASTFIFQLWEEEDTKERTISVLINGQPYPIPICNYSSQCPLNQFQKWFDSYRVQSPNQECGVIMEDELNQTYSLLIFIAFCAGLMTPSIYQKLTTKAIPPIRLVSEDAQITDLIE